MKRSKKRSIGILILFLSIVFIIGVYSINTNTQNRHLQVAMSIYEQNESDFLHLVTDKNSITFNLDIAYNTSTNQTLRLYLLSNFQLAPYSLNGKPPSLKNELHLESSNNIQVTKGNQIVINNLNARKNDLSLLLVSDSMIATKRFQIDNVNGEVLALVPKVELIPSEKKIYNSYQVATVDGKTKLYVDFVNHIKGSRSENDLISDKILFNSAIVLFSEKEETFDLIGYSTHKTLSFSLNLDCFTKIEKDSIRIIVFPYPYEYSDNLLNSYKAILWSNPVSTNKIRIGEHK